MPTTLHHLPNYFEALVASSNDAIVTEAMDGTIVSFNPAAERLYGLRAEDVVGRPVAEVHPTSQSARIREARMAARRGEHVPALEATRAMANGGILEFSVGFSPIRAESGEVIGITAIVRDTSHRPSAHQDLQTRARQQAAVAWFGQRALASGGFEALMSDAVDLITRTLDVEFVKLLTVAADRTSLILRAGTGWRPELIGTTVSDISRSSPEGRALLGGEPVIFTNLTSEPIFPGPSFLHDHGIVSGMSVVVRGPQEPFGVLGAHAAIEHPFSVDDLHFLEAIANILASAISRFRDLAQLEQRVAERTRELRTLLDISHDAAATLEIGLLARLILDRIRGVVDYTGAAMYVLDESGEGLNLLRYQGPIPLDSLNYRWTLATHDHARETIETARPVIIGDVFGDDPLAEALRRNAVRDLGEVRADFGSWMSVPMRLGARVTGMLAVESDQTDCYTEHHAELLMAVADQAAVAVENAHLYEQARGLAALEERQKLARELHDSVSQALYGIALGARTARTLLDRDPTKAAEPLDYVVSLAEAGLTEMRALIFELRPDALELEGLVGSLEKQLAAMRARHGLRIEANLGREPEVPLDVKETLYRIAQETLNNVVKHARASSITVELSEGAHGIRLAIADDGVGYDPTADFPGHLGLRSMRERAARIGAVLETESTPGQGTRACVLVPPSR